MDTLPILIIASFERGKGSGHLVRSTTLTREIRRTGREAFLCILGNRPLDDACRITGGFDNFLITPNEIEDRRWAFIVTDLFSTSQNEFLKLHSMAPLIGIDEGGKNRRDFDFLIDILPSLPEKSEPNILQTAFISLPENRKTENFAPIPHSGIKILIVFGAEDPENLAFLAGRAALSVMNAEIIVISGVLHKTKLKEETVQDNFFDGRLSIVEKIDNLREQLADFDIVITHFGLTAFESVYAGTPVILISPTSYHERLARARHFYSAGIGLAGIRHLRKIFSSASFEKAVYASRTVAKEYFTKMPRTESLAAFISSRAPYAPRNCPVCSAPAGRVLARLNDKTYRRCGICGTISMSRLTPPDTNYAGSYFFEDYAKQYGKTYLEDFSNLTAIAKKRVVRIKELIKRRSQKTARFFPNADSDLASLSLLDIGCAYGPFLAAAKGENFASAGVDPSEEAVAFVNKKLAIEAVVGSFPDVDFGSRQFDVITLWYVIEHFKEPAAVLNKIKNLLKPEGILALSTPSSSGVSGLFSSGSFFKNSPQDHWTIWSPRTIRKTLRLFNFSVKNIVITGHHPERLPVIGHFLERGFLRAVFMLVSKIFALGDTFEVYAVLNTDSHKEYKTT
ncbi:MAG: methyltransferase domain-containing protein [Spirochaetaceae bacterium]|jgi:2-polyprenyl-3-methyl-5-hydroxy-6-metoxy-1,4-benzoquinol methylase/spore coat polysaccharide biosynthesis predicted glycosyltransferase SpsG|nr:methyltransferase domain-containing protein [Spirochaetaceae bacterium]